MSNIDWDSVSPEEIKWLHGWGRDSEIRANGYGDHLDKYLSSVEQGITWDPNDMSNVPRTVSPSRLNEQGMRETVDLGLPDDDDEEEFPPYDEWKKDDLVAECKARGLDSSGNKEDLALRLMEHDEANEGEGEQPPVEPDYDAFKRSELIQILQQRGLPVAGKNDELIARLREDDNQRRNG